MNLSYEQRNIKHARVVTQTVTYVKHTFSIVDDVAIVTRGDVKATLPIAEVSTYPHGALRVVGTDGTVWQVDNQGCGCGYLARVHDTPEDERPT